MDNHGAALQCPVDARVIVVPSIADSLAVVSVNGVDVLLTDVLSDSALGLASLMGVCYTCVIRNARALLQC